jgi:hypothetical protein
MSCISLEEQAKLEGPTSFRLVTLRWTLRLTKWTQLFPSLTQSTEYSSWETARAATWNQPLGELVTASQLIVSPFRRFGLTILTGVKSKNEGSKTEAIHFPRRGQESWVTDIEDIEIHDDHFMFFCIKFKYLGTFSVLELSDMADIT